MAKKSAPAPAAEAPTMPTDVLRLGTPVKVDFTAVAGKVNPAKAVDAKVIKDFGNGQVEIHIEHPKSRKAVVSRYRLITEDPS